MARRLDIWPLLALHRSSGIRGGASWLGEGVSAWNAGSVQWQEKWSVCFMKQRTQSSLPPRLLWVVGLALALRLLFVLAYEQFPPLKADDAGYDSAGWNLALGKGYLDRFITAEGIVTYEPLIAYGPVYPTFLAGTYFLFGHSILAVKIIQALIGTATVWILFIVARTAFEERTALLASVLAMVHPALISYTGMLLVETLFAFLLMLAVWAVMVAVRSRYVYVWVCAGIVLGVTVLLRTESLVMVMFLVCVLAWHLKSATNLRNTMILVMAAGLIVSVWTVRNYLVFDETILVTANGAQVWISTTGLSEWPNDDEESYKSLVQGLSYIERSHVLRREGIRNMLREPIHYLRLCFGRLPDFWVASHTTYLVGFSDSFGTYYDRGALARVIVKGALLFINLCLVGLACWGAWTSVYKGGGQQLFRVFCLCPIIAIAMVHFFIFSASRYQVPVLPFILIFSVVGASELWRRFRCNEHHLGKSLSMVLSRDHA